MRIAEDRERVKQQNLQKIRHEQTLFRQKVSPYRATLRREADYLRKALETARLRKLFGTPHWTRIPSHLRKKLFRATDPFERRYKDLFFKSKKATKVSSIW